MPKIAEATDIVVPLTPLACLLEVVVKPRRRKIHSRMAQQAPLLARRRAAIDWMGTEHC